MSAEPTSQKPVRRNASRGFTLIEMMLVVVIIGVLSSFALPYFQRVSARARRSEAMMVLEKLHVYFFNQYENNGTFQTPEVCGMFGGTCGAPQASAWNPDPAVKTGQGAPWNPNLSGWKQIPFAFEGGLKLRYQYSVTDKDHMTITVVGDMPGLGNSTGTPAGNYTLTETLQGPMVFDTTEVPQM